jgi:uncharacterized protein (TIGR00369 family)
MDELYAKLYRNFLFNIVTELVPFVKNMELRLVDLGRGRMSLEMPVKRAVQNHVNSAHAGALYTLMETVAGGVIVSAVDILKVSVLVKGATVEYHHPGLGTLTCKAAWSKEELEEIQTRLKGEGKATPVIQPEVFDEQGQLVAKSAFTYSLKAMG